MEKLYSFYDYEEAYHHMRYYKCKEIGLYLLPLIHNQKAKELYNKLKITDCETISQEEIAEVTQLLFEVKIWIMIHNI